MSGTAELVHDELEQEAMDESGRTDATLEDAPSPLLKMPIDTLTDFGVDSELIAKIKSYGIDTLEDFCDSWDGPDSVLSDTDRFAHDEIGSISAAYNKVCDAVDAGTPVEEADVAGATVETPAEVAPSNQAAAPVDDRVDHGKLLQIQAAEAEVAEAETAFELAKARATQAKKIFDSAVDRLRQTIRSPFQPLLPGLGTPTSAESPTVEAASTEAVSDVAPTELTPWWAEPIEGLKEYGVAEQVIAKLRDHNVTTLGEFMEQVDRIENEEWIDAIRDQTQFETTGTDDLAVLYRVYNQIEKQYDVDGGLSEMKASKAVVEQAPASETPEAQPEDEDNAWRFEKLEVLLNYGVKPRTIELIKLADFSPETLGDVATWFAAKPGRSWTSIRGIGSGQQQILEDAQEQYFADRKQNLGNP